MLVIPMHLHAQEQDQWEIVNEGELYEFWSVDFINQDIGWHAGGQGLFRTTDGGKTWSEVEFNDGRYGSLQALHFKDGVGWAAGDNSLILKIKYAPANSVDRFMVVGDMHHYSPAADLKQTLLYELALAAIDEEVDFVFFPGDLVIRSFRTPEEEESYLKDWRFVLDTLGFHNIRVFACRGNNDYSREAWDSLFSGPYSLPANGPETEKNITYILEYDNLCLVAMDLYTDAHKVNQEWLDEVLSGVNAENLFVAGHEAAFKVSMTNMMNMFPEERNRFWESLEEAGAEAYLCGHDHFYDRSVIDNGDGDPGNDVQQVIVGTGGGGFQVDGEYNGDNGTWTPVRQFHEAEYGYLLVELNGEDAEITWKHRVGPHEFEYGGDSFTFSPALDDPPVPAPGTPQLVNYPNPFHGSTVIRYYLEEPGPLELNIYDLSGRKVMTLTEGLQTQGKHETGWNAEGRQPGFYFCELKTGRGRQVVKMILF
jgi:predicted phosphodiesterase